MGLLNSKKEQNEEQNDNIEEENNGLKIVLYSRKPRYTFERESFKNLITKDTLGHSLDIKRELAFVNSRTPLLDGFYLAHSNHYPIRIKPDDIWLLIVQAFSNHVNINSEELRNMFVDFSGKKTLAVNYGLSSINQIEKKHLEDFSEQINNQMKKYLGEELLDILTPNFTTTTYDSSIVCKISIMGAFKKYFDYKMHLCGCGIPYIILEGTEEDYEKIISKCEKLKKYNFEWYIDRILIHIHKMVEAKKGKIDNKYFKNFVQDTKATEFVSGKSGRGGHNIKIDAIKGWILSFFAYYGEEDRDEGIKKFTENSLKVKDFKKLANQMLTVPFKIIDVNKKEYLMKYSVGFVGCDQNDKNEVFPVTGWLVSPSTEEDRENKL